MGKAKKHFVYLDHASTTPVRPEVFKAMQRYFSEKFGNPSNIYRLGRDSALAVEDSKIKIARIFNFDPSEFIFTGSATEADNLAIAGVARANKELGNRIIISSVEHKGIVAICEQLKKEGFEIIKIPVYKNGLIILEELKKSLNEKTILVSVTMADSETGTIQPVAEIFNLIKNFRHTNLSSTNHHLLITNHFPLLHTDASQATAYLNIDVQKLGVDLMTLSSHKMSGPKGIAGLFVKKGVSLKPLIFGGGQQGKIRSGTENVPGIMGFGEAARLNEKNKKAKSAQIKKMRDELEKGIFKTIPKVILNGHPKKRLPNFLNVSILDIEGEALLLSLDELGIMAGTGSACNSESLEPSYVLTAQGNPYEFVHGSIRFTLGEDTKENDIKYVLKNLPAVVERLRKISPLNLSLDKKGNVSSKRAFVGNQTPHFLK